MLNAEMIRDVGRALPWLVAEPQSEPIPTGVSLSERTEFLDVHAEDLRSRHDTLYPVIDRAGHKLTAAFEELDPASIVDPEGEGAEALEKAEAYFHAQRDDLARLRSALIDAGAPPDHGVWVGSDDLIAAMRTFDTAENRGYLLVSEAEWTNGRTKVPLPTITPGRTREGRWQEVPRTESR